MQGGAPFPASRGETVVLKPVCVFWGRGRLVMAPSTFDLVWFEGGEEGSLLLCFYLLWVAVL